jgi:hypothetical protein
VYLELRGREEVLIRPGVAILVTMFVSLKIE